MGARKSDMVGRQREFLFVFQGNRDSGEENLSFQGKKDSGVFGGVDDDNLAKFREEVISELDKYGV